MNFLKALSLTGFWALSFDTWSDTLMKQEEDIAKFAAAYTAAWNSDKPKEVAAFYASNGALTINGGEPAAGRAAVEQVVADFMTAFPDLVLSNDNNAIVDGRVNYHWTFVGTNTGPEGTGNAVNFSGFESWIFNAEGLIQDSIGSFDAEDYERQLAQE
ncbi:DUF1348 family protein [Congregibacter brevis]|uniref:DUF1348 family protein n=1 Tax=Congregibacter brevis TaxID=3081201 RepID=A0ABZ0ID85_9GAMM|nr:DUF1348 family protein [Congregibacter sp. IMCC45268]